MYSNVENAQPHYQAMANALNQGNFNEVYNHFRDTAHEYKTLQGLYRQLNRRILQPKMNANKGRKESKDWQKANRKLRMLLFWRSWVGQGLISIKYAFTACCQLPKSSSSDFQYTDENSEEESLIEVDIALRGDGTNDWVKCWAESVEQAHSQSALTSLSTMYE